MQTIFQAILDVTGVGAVLVFDSAGRLASHRSHASHDQALWEQFGVFLLRAVDTVQLEQEDWESISARYADGRLLLRNLGTSDNDTHVLAVVADATLNQSFATVALRVAANRIKTVLGAGAASSALAAAPPLAAASSSHASSLLARSMPASSRTGLAGSSGMSRSRTSSAELAGIAVANPTSSSSLPRPAREVARHLGPKAEVRVKEAVRRVSPDAPLALTLGPKLLDNLAGRAEGGDDRKRFRQTLAHVVQVPPANHPKWIELVTGKTPFRPSFVLARMFLASTRMEIGRSGANPKLIRQYAAKLHELFAENSDSPSVRQDLARIMKVEISSDGDTDLSPMGS
ncbi:MAG: hypothetical protein A2V77_20955 [Anaeromyxobacter sp. RBG_16_69_14]|nr:MAG: hypothetical protein A2V77_20955 [Anaeromyxobacter sp. RBG_16_69_14]